MKTINTKILQTMLDRYGEDEQMRQAMGECGEFIADAQNYYRAKKYGHKTTSQEDMLQEAADTYIMMLQMRHINPELFDACVERKMKVIEEKMSKYTKEDWG